MGYTYNSIYIVSILKTQIKERNKTMIPALIILGYIFLGLCVDAIAFVVLYMNDSDFRNEILKLQRCIDKDITSHGDIWNNFIGPGLFIIVLWPLVLFVMCYENIS